MAAAMWISPYALIVSVVVITVFAIAHPTVAIAVAGSGALVIVIGVVQRLRGHLFRHH
jgi:hypothetical protein